ncbi:MAG: DEAD/DEAH box helicase family protein, partial [Erysipelotrichaceae bacterium]
TSFIFSVAFISFGGLQLLLRSFDKLKNSQTKGRILTSDYQNFTDPKALRKIFEFKNIDTKIYLQDHFGGFHTKAYIFEFEDYYKVYIGSSNITESALIKNVEWNIRIISKEDNPFIIRVIEESNFLWDKTETITEKFLNEYELFIQTLRESHLEEEKFIYHDKIISPNTMQSLAIKNLHSLRTRGEDRALVIAATATGKTYMSAFDVAQFKPKKMLFIVHREDILDKAIESYQHVLGQLIDIGKFTGTEKNYDVQYLFATTQSLLRHYTNFEKDEFEYIVVDETHHAMAEGNQSILNYFKPKFMLGMTATPERSDGYSLFSFYNNNVALEIRLFDAIEQELVSPFHYFGITELEGINLSDIDENDIDTITQRLSINTRVKYIIEKLNLFSHDGNKLKCLGFCAGIEHAKYMESKFNENGIPSKAIWGELDVPTREAFVKKLEDEQDELQVLFVVDVFNEGIDIPSVNMVLMLRPTNSPIIFIQQLGRGLRKLNQKKFLTVIDFIGNYKKSFLIAVALKGARYYDKDSLKVAVVNDFSDIPGDTFIQIDEIAKEQILFQLDNENFNKLKYLKEEYFAFKRLLGNRTPDFLMSYLYLDGSPDPLKFIHYSKSYLDFLSIMEVDGKYKTLCLTSPFIQVIRQISRYLPLCRPNEFIILKHLVTEEKWDESIIYQEIESYVPNIDDKTIQHSIKNLTGEAVN